MFEFIIRKKRSLFGSGAINSPFFDPNLLTLSKSITSFTYCNTIFCLKQSGMTCVGLELISLCDLNKILTSFRHNATKTTRIYNEQVLKTQLDGWKQYTLEKAFSPNCTSLLAILGVSTHNHVFTYTCDYNCTKVAEIISLTSNMFQRRKIYVRFSSESY